MRVMFASGGTGGHIYPGLTLAQELQRRGEHEVLFVGTKRGLEGELVKRAGYPILFIQSAPLSGGVMTKAKNLWTMQRGIREARALIARFEPQIVVGTGGYACGPVVLAARLAKVPVLLQEQNALPGKANKLLSNWAQAVALGYSQAAPYFPRKVQGKLHFTGNPIREQLLSPPAESAYGLVPGKNTVLLLGASQGARRLNQAAAGLYELAGPGKRLQLLHQSGPKLFAEARGQLEQVAAELGGKVTQEGEGVSWAGVHLYPYLYDMSAAYGQADLVITRAGAGSLSEIMALGLPAVLVPYPHAAADHQTYNAKVLAEAGAGILMADSELSAQSLVSEVTELLASPAKLASMAENSRNLGRPKATGRIVDLILSLAK